MDILEYAMITEAMKLTQAQHKAFRADLTLDFLGRFFLDNGNLKHIPDDESAPKEERKTGLDKIRLEAYCGLQLGAKRAKDETAQLLAYLEGYILGLPSDDIDAIKCAIENLNNSNTTAKLLAWLYTNTTDTAQKRIVAALKLNTDKLHTYAVLFAPNQADLNTQPIIQQETRQTADNDTKPINKQLLAQNYDNDNFNVSIDKSVFCLIGETFDTWHTDKSGYVDFQLKLLERTLLFPYLLEPEDVLIAIACDSIRATGARYMTPLDIWHKIFWGFTNKDSKGSETEKKLIKSLKQDKGTLADITERVERLMHLECIYRVYKTKKKNDRKPADLLREWKGMFIAHRPRVKIPGYKNVIAWAIPPKTLDVEYDDFSSLPYIEAIKNNRLISFPAAQIDIRKLEINSTLHIASIRDAILRLVVNAQSHGGKLAIDNVNEVYEYGRFNARQQLEIAQATPEEKPKIKDKARIQKKRDAQIMERLGKGLQATGVLKEVKTYTNGGITAETTKVYELKPQKKTKK